MPDEPDRASAALPDLLASGLSVVFCGINPGLRAAASGHHFDGRGTRFWRVMHLAGFTPRQLRPEEDRELLGYGCGSTTVVERATRAADELSARELAAASQRFEAKIRLHAPRALAFLGKAAYAALSSRRSLAWGRQSERFAEAEVWVLPNPSGRNLAFGLEALVEAYRPLRAALLQG